MYAIRKNNLFKVKLALIKDKNKAFRFHTLTLNSGQELLLPSQDLNRDLIQ